MMGTALSRTNTPSIHSSRVTPCSLDPENQNYDKCDSIVSNNSKLHKKSKQNIVTLVGHEKGITCVSLDSNNALLVTGSDDCTARIWEIASNECLAVLKGHYAYISSVAFQETGDIFAITASADHTIRKWGPLPDHVEVNQFQPHKKGKINDMKIYKNICFSACYDTTIIAIDLNTGDTLREFTGHKHSVITIVYTMKRDFFNISGQADIEQNLWMDEASDLNNQKLASGSADWSIRVWDIVTGSAIQVLKGHSGAVMSVTFDEEKICVISASKDATIRKWNILSGQCLHVCQGHESSVTKVMLDPLNISNMLCQQLEIMFCFNMNFVCKF